MSDFLPSSVFVRIIDVPAGCTEPIVRGRHRKASSNLQTCLTDSSLIKLIILIKLIKLNPIQIRNVSYSLQGNFSRLYLVRLVGTFCMLKSRRWIIKVFVTWHCVRWKSLEDDSRSFQGKHRPLWLADVWNDKRSVSQGKRLHRLLDQKPLCAHIVYQYHFLWNCNQRNIHHFCEFISNHDLFLVPRPPFQSYQSSFSEMNRFASNSMNWTESAKHEYGSIIASHKHRRHSSVVIKVPDW